jgi:DNA primase
VPSQQQNITVSLKSTLSQERQVVKNLLIFGDKPFSDEISVASYMLSELAEVEWENPNCKRLFEEVQQALEKQPEGLDFSYFVNVEDPELQKFVSDLVIEAHKLDEGWKKFLQRPVVAPADNYIEEVTSALNHFKLRMVMKLIKENEKDLKNTSVNEEVDQLLTVHMHLTEMKKQLCKEMGIILV